MSRVFFSRFRVFQRIFRLVCFLLVVQKQTPGKVGTERSFDGKLYQKYSH